MYQIQGNIFDLFYFQYLSNITLKIKGIGNNNIFNTETSSYCKGFNYPDEVIINGNKEKNINNKYYFNQTDNFVELIWNDSINNCSCLFKHCSNITVINLSNFNTSLVITMFQMFYGCSSLTSLNLSNLNTSLVKTMGSMFRDCSKLTSLDLSSFNTSQIYIFTFNVFRLFIINFIKFIKF